MNEYREPTTVALECQDWFTSWETVRMSRDETDAVLTYCRQFYFGE